MDSQSVTIYLIVRVYFSLYIYIHTHIYIHIYLLHVPHVTTIIWKMGHGIVFVGLQGPHI